MSTTTETATTDIPPEELKSTSPRDYQTMFLEMAEISSGRQREIVRLRGELHEAHAKSAEMRAALEAHDKWRRKEENQGQSKEGYRDSWLCKASRDALSSTLGQDWLDTLRAIYEKLGITEDNCDGKEKCSVTVLRFVDSLKDRVKQLREQMEDIRDQKLAVPFLRPELYGHGSAIALAALLKDDELALTPPKAASGEPEGVVLFEMAVDLEKEEIVEPEPLSGSSEKGDGVEAVCANCGAPATCHGKYEAGIIGFACDQCCGHGNEDGWCNPVVATKAPEPTAKPASGRADAP